MAWDIFELNICSERVNQENVNESYERVNQSRGVYSTLSCVWDKVFCKNN